CDAGTYKVVPGTGQCSTCPAGTSSAGGGSKLTDCICVAGYTAGLDGVACSACDAGTYKASTGTVTCSSCPANAES
ncbi:hypothetical protein T484DRAFT_1600577, partial [Baffinella frigidus]